MDSDLFLTEPGERPRFRSRIVFWLFGLFLIAVAAVTGLWFLGAQVVRGDIAVMGRAVAGPGGTFSTGAIDITGFPFGYNAEIRDLVITGQGEHGPWEWQADHVTASLKPWRTSNIAFDLSGAHKLRVSAGGVPLDLELHAARAHGEVHQARAGVPDMLKIDTTGLTAREVTTGRQLAADRATAQVFLYPGAGAATAPTEPAAGLLLDLRGVDLPEGAARLLGPELDHVSAEIQVLGGLPLPVDRTTLARWREQGGSIEIRGLGVQWGPARVTASGTAALDQDLQPEGSFSARITGFEPAIDALVDTGLIPEQQARGVKLLLELMARRSDPDEPAEIRVPVSIQDREVFIGPARLMRLPEIKW